MQRTTSFTNRNTSVVKIEDRQQTLQWLITHNYPALPVAPAQPPHQYHKVVQAKPSQNIWQHCPLTANLQPIPLYTGKNPSYLDETGTPHLVNHSDFQKRLPSPQELKTWFAHPANGVGTLGGWNNTTWLDFDVKQFPTQDECDAAVLKILEQEISEGVLLSRTFIERSHSGGWRIGVRAKQKSQFTNFSLTPGGTHVGEALGKGRFTVLAPTIGPSGNPYQSINRVLPVEVESLESIGIYPTSTRPKLPIPPPQPTRSSPIPGSIPLEALGHSESQEILKGANPKQDRSNSLTTAINEWYGWYYWAQDNSIAVSGTPIELAHHAGQQLGLDADRINRIIKSVNADMMLTPAALHRGGEESCWKKIRKLDRATFERQCPAHIKDNVLRDLAVQTQTGGKRSGAAHQGKDSSENGDNNQQFLTGTTMRQRVSEILSTNLSPSAETETFKQLALSNNWQLSDIRTLATELESEWDTEDSRLSRKQELDQLEKYKERTLTLSRYLPACYAQQITRIASWMETPTAAYLTILLGAFASCNHPHTRIVVKQSIGFIEPLIIYSGIVTESGQRKSPVMNVVLDALKELQAEEEERFKQETHEYEQQLEQWQESKSVDPSQIDSWQDDKPTPPRPIQEFYLDKATVEAIDAIKGRQQNCSMVLIKDELSGLFASYGAYKNGRGEDRQSILSSWNGRGTKKNLKGGERVSTLRDSMSIVGAIQDSYLQKLMGNFDDDLGEWARFLWTLIPLKALRLPSEDAEFQLGFLKDLYARARQLSPQEYKFAFDAQALYDHYHWQLEQRRVSHPRRGMRAAISKMEGYAARLALALHLIWELAAGKTHPSQFIPKERVKAAIALSEFYLSQVELIHVEGAAALGEGGLSHRLSAILSKLKQLGELRSRTIQAAISWLRKESPGKLRQDLIELAKLGYGKLVGKGNRLKLVYTATSVDTVEPTVEPTVENENEAQLIDIRSIQDLTVDSADTVDTPPVILNEEVEHDVDEIVESDNLEPDDQQFNSLALSSEQSSVVAADDLSTDVSTVEPDPDPDDDPEPPSPDGRVIEPSPPTLQELQALLLACQSLTELRRVQNQYKEQTQEAYRGLSLEQQLQIDGLTAAIWKLPIYKYCGPVRIWNDNRLSSGELVRLVKNTKLSGFYVDILDLNGKWSCSLDVAPKHLMLVPPYQAPPSGEQLSFV